MDRLERIQRRVTKIDTELGGLPSEEKVREQGFYKPEKRRLRKVLVTMFQCLKGGYRENGDSILQGGTWQIW